MNEVARVLAAYTVAHYPGGARQHLWRRADARRRHARARLYAVANLLQTLEALAG